MSTAAALALILFSLAAALGLLGSEPVLRRAAALLSALGSAALFWPALLLLADDRPEQLLRGVVLLAIAASSLLASLHSLSYANHWDRRQRAATMAAAFPVFIAAMSVVAQAQSFVTFLIAWEVMTLASAALVAIDHEEPANREALVWYLAIGHLSPAAFVLAIALLSPAAFDWSALAAAATTASGGVRSAAFVLVLIGAAAKAGLVPLHSWLPRAHPAAPSHVSAVMSGAMVTLGALAFYLLAPATLGNGPAWWSWTLIILGAASALTGGLYALVVDDLKRLLAYSTIENMGLLFVELGIALIAAERGLPALHTLALAAAAAHIASHALAKTTLFLGAGSIIHLTGTRLLNRMGGTFKQEPLIGWGFMLAAAGVIALPPLAGFTNEWLLVRALMQAAASLRGLPGLAIAVVLGLVALTSGLAVAAYAKAVGIGLLGSLRKEEPAHTVPIGGSERLTVLAGAALVALAPLAFAATFQLAAGRLAGLDSPLWADVASAAERCAYMAAGLTFFVLLILAVSRGRAGRVRVTDPWLCGLFTPTARMQYTADSFSQPLARVFAAVLRPSVDVDVDVHPYSEMVRGRRYRRQSTVLFERTLYTPLLNRITALSRAVKRLHNGRVSSYASWLVLTILALMAYGRWGF